MSLINKRIFVEKKDRFRTEAQDLYNELKENLQLSAEGLRLFNIYDIFDIDSEDYVRARRLSSGKLCRVNMISAPTARCSASSCSIPLPPAGLRPES